MNRKNMQRKDHKSFKLYKALTGVKSFSEIYALREKLDEIAEENKIKAEDVHYGKVFPSLGIKCSREINSLLNVD